MCRFCAGWTVYLIQAVAQILDRPGQVSGLSPRPCSEHGAGGGERERHGTEQRPCGTERPCTPPLHYPMHCHAWLLLLLQLHHSTLSHAVTADALCVPIVVSVPLQTFKCDCRLWECARSVCCFPEVSSECHSLIRETGVCMRYSATDSQRETFFFFLFSPLKLHLKNHVVVVWVVRPVLLNSHHTLPRPLRI